MIKIVRNVEEMLSLKTEWNKLAERFNSPLLMHEWFIACAEALYMPDQLFIVLNYSNKGLEAIAPLVQERNSNGNKIGFLGASILGEPSGFIYKDEESLDEIISFLFHTKRPISLRGLKADSLDLLKIRKMNKKSSIILLRGGSASPFIPISMTWAQFEDDMSSGRRYDLRRARKRAEELGEVHFEIVCPEVESLDHYIKEILKVEAAGWKGRQSTALLFDERLRHFFTVYSKIASGLGTLRLCFLRINTRAAAVLLALQIFNRFWALKLGYDETFSKCSPGILLMNETVRYAFQNRLDTYEFLGRDDPWIHMWTEKKHQYVTVRIYPFSFSGEYCLVKDIVLAFTKRTLEARRR